MLNNRVDVDLPHLLKSCKKNYFIADYEGMEKSAVSKADLFSKFKTCQASRLGSLTS